MFEDFKFYGHALGLESCCLCGGMLYAPQESKLKRGVDIVVGTPGRVKVQIYNKYWWKALLNDVHHFSVCLLTCAFLILCRITLTEIILICGL